MNNLDKLTNVFVTSFELETDEVMTATYKGIDLWDSVGQMTLIANIEDEFDIIIDPQDIMEIKSFETARQILVSNYNIAF